MPEAPKPGLLLRLARLEPRFGRALVGLFRFTPVPAPRRVVRSELPDGRRMVGRMDDHTQRKVLLGAYEPNETALMERFLAPGDTFVDVGANIGWFSTVASSIVGPTGRVLAFEPFPANAALLRTNVRAVGADNATVLEAAVSDAEGTLDVGRQGPSDSGSVTAGPWGTHDVVQVPMVTLDSAIPTGDVAFLKIDVEGFEAHVLRGAVATLARTRAVLIELNREALGVAGSSPEELVAMLRTAGLTDMRLVESPQADLERLPDFSNLLAARPPS